MTQAADSALERILLTEPSSGTKAMPSDIVGCAAEYVAGQGWIGNLGVLDSKAVLDSFPTNALVPGKVWAVVASANSFAKYNYMSAGWVVESSVGPTGSSNLPGSISSPFTTTAERDAWAAANPGNLTEEQTAWTLPGPYPSKWIGPATTDWDERDNKLTAIQYPLRRSGVEGITGDSIVNRSCVMRIKVPLPAIYRMRVVIQHYSDSYDAVVGGCENIRHRD